MATPATRYYGNNNNRQDDVFVASITSQDILDENNSTKRARKGRKKSSKAVVFLLLGVCAIAGAAVAYFATQKSGDSTEASNSSGGNGSSGGKSGKGGSSGTISESAESTGGGGYGGNAKVKVTTDPTAEKYTLGAFAIGDWGSTAIVEGGSCCSRRKGKYNAFDLHSERAVSKLMALEAANHKPSAVLGHGDNFYWTGIHGPKDQSYRFQLTFEDRHGEESMMDVPWINVMGNHDYGGGSYICVDSDEELAPCKDAKAVVAALQEKFDLQSSYKSPNNDRWVIKDHFYKYTIEDGDVSMDIFNLDINNAEAHGSDQICCQCYSYSEGNDTLCKKITRGHEMCCGGDVEMYDACMKQFKDWGEDSKTQLLDAVKKSTATWKIVNSHYSPYGHFGETSGKEWMQALESSGGIQLWIAGHTHGEKHDYASFGMHFIENGAGGGIQSEPSSGIPAFASDKVSNVWAATGLEDGNTYGFFSLQASSTWLKVRYMSFDSNWALTKEEDGLDNGKIGGVEAKYCWYIPADGSQGQKC
ncbi:hypothetical protein Poli38472_014293 [Pythium oligandrum]|uniref:Calcineurin-like phosphoesterase domain-containing protein n=1 Tax=Pythium oligandrum TaxID=41045 RepID=A0A8K1CIF1_PYTOL|nr:hypothetical protein Poli38472_014293 [Pythium oligandrum]|eukprot:TMW64176.1 hypothetical protein Poli38472_014293 [Pythium oligandrum]